MSKATPKKTQKEILEETYSELKADFPKDAYSVDSSRGFDLTSLKAQYIVERLNETFTFAGWKLTGDYRVPAEGGGVLYFGKLQVTFKYLGLDLPHEIDAIGYCAQKKNVGDMYKAAATDCLSKACSKLGIGNEIFKGNVSPHTIKEDEDVAV